MAKQRGVIQLSGRVDNLCYYQQKRVRGGLVRRINLAMSERAKVGSEYERLRAANSYFGACSMCASAVLSMTGSRSKFLHYPDRNALLTKVFYEFSKRHGVISSADSLSFTNNDGYFFSLYYDKIVKNKMSNFLPSVPFFIADVSTESSISLTIPTHELEDYCLFNKCVGVSVSVVSECALYGSYRSTETNKFIYPDYTSSTLRVPIPWKIGDNALNITFNSGAADDTLSFAIISVLPVTKFIGNRAVTKLSGAACRLIGIVYN